MHCIEGGKALEKKFKIFKMGSPGERGSHLKSEVNLCIHNENL